MAHGKAIAVCLLLAAAVGCGSPGPTEDAGKDGPADVKPDAALDTKPDASPDAAPDVAADVGTDVAVDTKADAMDTAPDQSGDLASDKGDAALETGTDATPADGGDGPAPTTFELVLLQTNDLHSYLEGQAPEVDYTPATVGDDTTRGGISRLAARIGAARAAAGSKPVLLLDSGDFMMGTAFELLGPSKAAELMELQSLQYDAITLGNHEFDWTPGGLALILGAAATKGFNVPIVATNMKLDPASTDVGAKAVMGAVKRKLVKTLPNGLKVGIFGLMGKDAVAVTPTMKPLTFDAIEVAAQAMVDELRTQDGVDVVIALSHSGINQAGQGEDAVLATKVPGIDVILSGHTHDSLTTAVKVGKTIITQAGRYGENLGKLSLTVTRNAGAADGGVYDAGDAGVVARATVTLNAYELVPIDDSVAGDATTETRVGTYKAAIDTLLAPSLSYSALLAKTTVDVPNAGVETAIGDLVTDAYRASVSALTPAEPALVAIDATGAIRAPLPKGKTGQIIFADAFRVLPLGIGPDSKPGYPLVSFFLNGADLRAGMEFAAAPDATGTTDTMLQVSGIEVHLDRTKAPFQRVTSLKIGATNVGLTDTTTCYKVTTTLYVANLLGLVAQATGGAMSVKPKEANCTTVVTDLTTRIVRTGATATSPELKAWQAFIGYLTSFPKDAGVPVIPTVYAAPQGRVTSP
jgi:5'-nucleotidase